MLRTWIIGRDKNCKIWDNEVQKKSDSCESDFLISEIYYTIGETPYFTVSTIALKASGLFIAKSAKTLRFNSTLLAFNFPMN